jgi:hypothetical protein
VPLRLPIPVADQVSGTGTFSLFDNDDMGNPTAAMTDFGGIDVSGTISLGTSSFGNWNLTLGVDSGQLVVNSVGTESVGVVYTLTNSQGPGLAMIQLVLPP